jgi:hypothetical protein
MVGSQAGKPRPGSGDHVGVIDGVTREAAGHAVEDLAQNENRIIIGLLKLRANGLTAS